MYTHMASFHFLLGLYFLSVIKYCPPLPQLGDESRVLCLNRHCSTCMCRFNESQGIDTIFMEMYRHVFG